MGKPEMTRRITTGTSYKQNSKELETLIKMELLLSKINYLGFTCSQGGMMTAAGVLSTAADF